MITMYLQQFRILHDYIIKELSKSKNNKNNIVSKIPIEKEN